MLEAAKVDLCGEARITGGVRIPAENEKHGKSGSISPQSLVAIQ